MGKTLKDVQDIEQRQGKRVGKKCIIEIILITFKRYDTAVVRVCEEL